MKLKRAMKFGDSVIVNGDSFELWKQIRPGSVDMMFCDPPYGLSTASKMKVTKLKTGWKGLEEKWDMFGYDKKGKFSKKKWLKDYSKFTMRWLARAKQLLKPNGTIFITGTFHNIGVINYCLQSSDFYLLNDITWLKPNAAPNFTCRQLCASTETVLWARRSEKISNHTFNYQEARMKFPDMIHSDYVSIPKKGLKKLRKTRRLVCPKDKVKYMLRAERGLQMRDIWYIPIVGGHETTLFPSQKPIELLRRCLTIASNPGDLVVDLFGGSGSTAVTCALEDRRFVVFEKGPEQFKLMYHRLVENRVWWDRDKSKVVNKNPNKNKPKKKEAA